MNTQLLILAAGIGRRFGGLKQLASVGPGGQALMDYTVYDAMRSGFDEVLLVIRRETETAVREHVKRAFGKHIAVTYVHQELDALPAGFTVPPGRTKPWGSGQALLAAAPVLRGSFAVANADDYYGRPAIAALGEFLAQPAAIPSTWAMIGFEAASTLPLEGMVTRALVRTEGGYLRAIDEIHTVRRHPDGVAWDGSDGVRVMAGSILVSMNLWGFDQTLTEGLEDRFRDFLADDPGEKGEFYLPEIVGMHVEDRLARVRVLPVASRWCGMTSAADLTTVRATMAALVADGTYPERLWP